MLTAEALPPLPEPAVERGTKLVPYEERFFRTVGLAAKAGYTNDLSAFYTKEQMREYGRACERAAYKLAAEACRAQKNPPPVLIADQVHYDPANVMAERCATVVSLLGADK